MTTRRPLDEVELLLIDGNNLLHRTMGGIGNAALRLLLAQLQQALQPPTQTVLMLDGHAARGSPARQRISGSLEVRHSGSVNGDDAIIQLLTARPYSARTRTVVVSDDRSLVERARSAGGRTQRLEWLQALMSRPAGRAQSGLGRRPPRPSAPESQGDAADEGESWRPGRGATKKRGNPARARRTASDSGSH